MTRKHFGTDGIRGKVGSPQMSADFVLRLGWAAGRVLAPHGGGTVLIGKDTRISGYMFESALEAGLSAAGVNVQLLGPMPTPAIAYLTCATHAQAGVVISASHNPFEDNGIKFFSADGRKLPDEIELRIEAELERPFATVDSALLGGVRRMQDAAARYIEFCKSSVDKDLTLAGLRLVLDCANGATYRVAPEVFAELGAQVTSIGTQPDGLNINKDCGSMHPDALRAKVLETGAHFGIAFDGDGDRVLMVDNRGTLVDGDELLFIIALARKQRKALRGPVVGTQMSNLGLEQALRAEGIAFHRAQVGDRYVLALLEEQGGILGGENSGHIICLDRTTTGDGIIAALQVLEALRPVDYDFARLSTRIRKYPQTLVNVRTGARVDLAHPSIRSSVADVERQLNGRGRVLLRASGTEPVIRIMVEAEEAASLHAFAESIAEAVRSAANH
ncbi:MAG: phosphoglucosamine mutase [Gammaproteobacteria bacterium]|nr:phosphoglucosamine mutase [Gammaproteobacteria bacterium]MDE2023473.1 phosphoglucosamine mutase [Gammaproteobacteria bacterium]